MNLKCKFRSWPMIILIGLTVLMFGCKSEGGNGDEEQVDSTMVDATTSENLNSTKEIFIGLPSPIETAMLMKRAGAKYDQALLNSPANKDKYTTNKNMALNLGVYSADLSFASMFDQSQASINYITICKKLAEDLGILNAISKETIERMEGNINNRDSLMQIISETFINSDAFLKENDRASTAAIVLAGGWTEGLYLATKIAKSTKSNKELINRIIDQKLTLVLLIKLLEKHKDDSNVSDVLSDLTELSTIFDKIKRSSSPIQAVTDEKTGITTLKSETQTSMSPEIFQELCIAAEKLRMKIVS